MSVISQKFALINCLLMLTLLIACSRSTSNEDFKKEKRNVSSWSATAQIVGNAWIQGNLPNQYAQQTLHKTQIELLKAREKISKIQLSNNANQPQQLLLIAKILQIANQTEEISQAIAQKWGAKHSQPWRIPWSKVLDVGIDVDIDVEAEETPALAYEKWLRDRIIKKIPGAE
ncbi:hypothetical protein H6G76_13950 [Nostoc sp. FACHB-152]|uniref:hypothetical protein n=1 Tax=unclassified Nostoc TaxID=2593658 RepID=UPI0016876676|nr:MULTISPECIES: hypothetical protein [unclassified Nostoc]MBD2448249.1 hypothetical protein [Nostoc sp. FACHB-152]MBD2469270.1 hypothetical protein [Nostoc sp. FACHB-145]